jgi:hypothetical protein
MRDAVDRRLNLDKYGNLTNLKTHLQTKANAHVRSEPTLTVAGFLRRILCFRVFDHYCGRWVPKVRCYLQFVLSKIRISRSLIVRIRSAPQCERPCTAER